MAERLREGEPPARGVRRIVRRGAAKALKRVDVDRAPADVAIHDARKRLKRARAALRLIRKPLGARQFRRENEAFRDAARPLGEIRDAKILVEAFDALVKDDAPHDRPAFRSVRDVLVAHQLRVRGRAFRNGNAMEPVLRALRSARRRAGGWSFERDGWSALRPGVRRVYRSGRKVLAVARAEPRDENLHELRKQAKYLWQELEILASIAPGMLRARAARARRLSDALGDDHDLAVLRQRLSHAPARVPRTTIAAVSRLIDVRRESL